MWLWIIHRQLFYRIMISNPTANRSNTSMTMSVMVSFLIFILSEIFMFFIIPGLFPVQN